MILLDLNRHSTTILWALVLSSSAAYAQTERANDGTITVTASKLTRDAIEREAEDYVRATAIAEGTRPAARWTNAICPTVIGVSPANADVVRVKIEAVAREVGVKVAARPCKSNIVIAFALDGRDIARKITSDGRKTRAFNSRNREKLVEAELPIRWWYSSETRSSSGMGSQTGQLPWAGSGDGGAQQGGGSPLNEISTIVQNNSSIVSTQVARVLTSATVIVDATLAQGASLDAVAAQIAMVSLAEIDITAKPTGSILSLFPDKAGVDDLSANDRELLRSLYALPLDRHARFHRGRLLQDIVKARIANVGPD